MATYGADFYKDFDTVTDVTGKTMSATDYIASNFGNGSNNYSSLQNALQGTSGTSTSQNSSSSPNNIVRSYTDEHGWVWDVDSNGQAYLRSGPSGGGSSGVSGNYGVSNNTAQIQQMYEQQKQAALAQLKQAIAQSKSQYQSQIETAPQTYTKLRDAVSTNYYKSLPSLREALANTGDLYGGMSRQEQLIAATAMQNDINELNLQEQNYINQLNKAIADLENSGSLEEAQIVADYAAKLQEALINESNRVSEQSYQRLQDALARSDKSTAQNYEYAQNLASSLGYVNPWAQYALTPDIMQQLAPYANDYAAFIQANPTSWLVPYAQNARFQKMLANPELYASELEKYRTMDYQANQLKNALTQAQISSTNALAQQRSTPKTSTTNTSTLLNYAATKAQNEINNLRNSNVNVTPEMEQQIINKWRAYYGLSSSTQSPQSPQVIPQSHVPWSGGINRDLYSSLFGQNKNAQSNTYSDEELLRLIG